MTDNNASLYAAWFNLLPELFRAMQPAGSAAAGPPQADAASAAPGSPAAADMIGSLFGSVNTMLTQLYHAYLPLLAQGGVSAQALKSLADAGRQGLQRMRESVALQQAAWSALQPWTEMSRIVTGAAPSGSGVDPLRLGIERTFGGLADAFGLGPTRELEQALRDMAVAAAERQRAQFDYLELVVEAFAEGTQNLIEQLVDGGRRGEPVESMLALIRMWAKAVDGPMHATMQSERGLAITTRAVRASTEHRQRLQHAVGLASEALHMPTRADVDEAYREIQQLKRELRKLKKALPPPAVQQVKESEA